MILKRRVLSPADQAELENAKAQAVKNAAYIDFIAMMTDVEIPTEEEGNDDESEI